MLEIILHENTDYTVSPPPRLHPSPIAIVVVRIVKARRDDPPVRYTVNDDSIALRLSAQRALWNHVPACMRSASVQKDGNTILWRCVFDAEATGDDLELASIAGAEIIADFSAPANIEEEIVIIPFPEKSRHLEHLVYLRHEHNY